MQGRLVPSCNGEIQCFPNSLWKNEFKLAQSIGLGYIELMLDEDYNEFNPLFYDSGYKKILQEIKKTSVECYSICNNYIIKHSILNDKSALESIKNLININNNLPYKILILPFFGKSEMNDSNLNKYTDILIELLSLCEKKKILLCIEANVSANILYKYISSFNSKLLGVVYDVGNRAVYNIDMMKEIFILKDKIYHIHIKDKNRENENVLLGTGIVDFIGVFKALKELNYKGKYTFESRRGKVPLVTALQQLRYIDFLRNEIE